MSKNITVSEGNTARVFGNTKKLETKLQGEDAGTCFWVPEDETDAQPLYITENGLYEASEAGVYGFSEAHVNISKNVTDEDGTDWNIHIDDEGSPHITVDDPDNPYTGPDISIDPETGNIDVHIPGNDPDSWPGWDDLDPDVKTDFDDWMDDPKFPGDWPGWDDMAPEIVDEFDDWIDDGNDPDLWPGWDDLDPDKKTDFDDWMDEPQNPDDWPGWEDIDPDTKTDFDEWTADTDTEIDPEDAGLDPDKDVDASFDPDEQDVDMVGTDGDGDESVVDYDPKTGEYSAEKCPAAIIIIQGPTKTEYSDGEKISINGIVVKAFDKNGNPWSDESHPDGIIPAKELSVTPFNASLGACSNYTIEGEGITGQLGVVSKGQMFSAWTDPNTIVKEVHGNVYAYLYYDNVNYIVTFLGSGYFVVGRYNPDKKAWTYVQSVFTGSSHVSHSLSIGWEWPVNSAPLPSEYTIRSGTQPIYLAWERNPCYNMLTESFNVSVVD